MLNPLRELSPYGQSVWCDGFRREMLTSGQMARWIEEDGLSGLTTNPTIYEKAIVGSRDYDADLISLFAFPQLSAKDIYEELAVRDIRKAADLLSATYHHNAQRDGFACLEVSPMLAQDPDGTLAEARRLWQAIQRPNVMIKVPGTPEVTDTIRHLLSEGININVTLLFSRQAYARVANAYIEALEIRASRGEELSQVAGVASFFVSRIDTLVDRMLDERCAQTGDESTLQRAEALRGRVAIANAKLAYQDYKALVAGPRWRRLRELGAQPQRLLWASTSTKNPRYRDVMYVEELIGPDTVDTMPPATLEAFREHGRVRSVTLEDDVDNDRQILADLTQFGISLDEVTDELLDQGIRHFAQPFMALLSSIEGRRGTELGTGPPA
jgi:transaldolase